MMEVNNFICDISKDRDSLLKELRLFFEEIANDLLVKCVYSAISGSHFHNEITEHFFIEEFGIIDTIIDSEKEIRQNAFNKYAKINQRIGISATAYLEKEYKNVNNYHKIFLINNKEIEINGIKYFVDSELIHNNNKDISKEQRVDYLFSNLYNLYKVTGLKYHYYFKSLYYEKDKKRNSLGYLVVSSKEKIDKNGIKTFKTISKELIFQISIIENNHSHTKQLKLINSSLTISAIAVIMAHELSHTDGSHVMKYFEKFIEMQDDIEKVKKYFLVYNKHLRNLMEYIADVSGGIGSQSLYNYNFNKILEEIINDYFLIKDGDFVINEGFLSKGLNDGKGSGEIFVDESLKNIPFVALPGGINGVTAILVIIKNFFRNSYKHSNTNNHEYKLRIRKEDVESKFKNDFIKISFTEENTNYNEKEIDKIVLYVNDLINKSIISNESSISDKGWGLLEMKISAAYLIGYRIQDEVFWKKNNINYPYNIIYATKIKEEDKYYLQFNFFLLKSKQAVYKYDNELSIVPEEVDILNKKGVFTKKNTENINFNDRAKFIISDSNTDKIKSSNFKVIVTNEELLNNIILKDDVEKVLGDLWIKKLLENKAKNNLEYIFVNSNTNDNGNKYIFDNHGKWAEKQPDKIKKLYYYEPFNSAINSKYVSIIAENNKYLPSFEWKIKEAIVTKIAILEERIQEKVYNDNNLIINEYKLRDLLPMKGIYIPKLNNDTKVFNVEDNINLSELMYGKFDDNEKTRFEILTEILKYYFYKKDCDYVALHFSGLETIIDKSNKFFEGKNQVDSLDEKYKYLLKELNLNNKYLILTSGKGTPSTLPNGAYFVSLINLEEIIYKSKLDIVELFSSIRRYSKKLTSSNLN